MRFIIGFIFFGLLFYAIYLYFPEAFSKLVSWAAAIFDFIKDLFDRLVNLFRSSERRPPQETSDIYHLFF